MDIPIELIQIITSYLSESKDIQSILLSQKKAYKCHTDQFWLTLFIQKYHNTCYYELLNTMPIYSLYVKCDKLVKLMKWLVLNAIICDFYNDTEDRSIPINFQYIFDDIYNPDLTNLNDYFKTELNITQCLNNIFEIEVRESIPREIDCLKNLESLYFNEFPNAIPYDKLFGITHLYFDECMPNSDVFKLQNLRTIQIYIDKDIINELQKIDFGCSINIKPDFYWWNQEIRYEYCIEKI